MTDDDQIIPVDIDGTVVLVTARVRGGEEEIAGVAMPSFSGVEAAIGNITRAVSGALRKAGVKKASIEFGCEMALESGQLTALIVKGSGSASLKITIDWEGE